MSISLQNVESRVRELENKIISTGYITEIKSNIIKYSNGLKIQWGSSSVTNGDNIVTFLIPWKDTDYIIVGNDATTLGSNSTSAGTIVFRDKKTNMCNMRTIHYNNHTVRTYVNWLAIGY